MCYNIFKDIKVFKQYFSKGVENVIIWPFLIEHDGNFAWLRSATSQPWLKYASLGRTQTACHSTARSSPIHSAGILNLQDDMEDILKWPEIRRYRHRHMYTNPPMHPSIHPRSCLTLCELFARLFILLLPTIASLTNTLHLLRQIIEISCHISNCYCISLLCYC